MSTPERHLFFRSGISRKNKSNAVVHLVFPAEPVSNFIGGVACFSTMAATVFPMLKREEQKLVK